MQPKQFNQLAPHTAAEKATPSPSDEQITFHLTQTDGALNTSLRAPSTNDNAKGGEPPIQNSSNYFIAALTRMGQLANPVYHARQFVNDYQAFQESRRSNYHEVAHEIGALSTSFQGKLFSSLIFSNIIGYTTGAVASAIYQGMTSNPVGAVMVNLGASYVAGFASFQALWAITNRVMYQDKYSSITERTIEFEKDLWPCHKKAFTAALQCYLISVPLGLGIGAAVGMLGETAARFLPSGFLSFALTTPLVEGLFIRLLGDFHSGYCSNLAQKYLKSKDRTSSESGHASQAPDLA